MTLEHSPRIFNILHALAPAMIANFPERSHFVKGCGAGILLAVMLPILFVASFCAQAEPVGPTNREVFLQGFFETLDPNYHSFWIDRDLLPGRISWERNQPFPFIFNEEIGRAAGFLVRDKGITNEVKLQKAVLKRTLYPIGDLANDQNQQEFTNTWVVALEFQELPPRPIIPAAHWVVMLLDGTYASERTRKKSSDQAEMANPVRVTRTVNAEGLSGRESGRPRYNNSKRPNPYELVRRSDFRVPDVQWAPETSLPVDLSSLVTRGYSDFVQTNGMPQQFAIQEICLERYSPDGAIRDNLTLILRHSWHWLITCTFAKKPGADLGQSFRSYTLLDGRTLMLQTPEE